MALPIINTDCISDEFISTGLAEKTLPAEICSAPGLLKWLPVIDVPTLAWTGLGAGLGLIWLDVPPARASIRVKAMVNRKEPLPPPLQPR